MYTVYSASSLIGNLLVKLCKSSLNTAEGVNKTVQVLPVKRLRGGGRDTSMRYRTGRPETRRSRLGVGQTFAKVLSKVAAGGQKAEISTKFAVARARAAPGGNNE